MKFSNWFASAMHYLIGQPPVTVNLTGVTFNTYAYFNVNVEAGSEQESTEPARKNRKTGKEKVKWMLQCNNRSEKPARHGKALRSNVTMKKRTLAAIKNDTNERSHLHRETTHPDNYYQ